MNNKQLLYYMIYELKRRGIVEGSPASVNQLVSGQIK